jgi:hypothetical protein
VLASAVACSDDGGPDDAETSASVATASPEFEREADRICTDAEQEFASLGDDLTSAPDDPDPIATALIAPGAEVYAGLADALRALDEEDPQPPTVGTYLDYFEIIDTLLAARLRVGQPGGPAMGDRVELEARFQRVAGEQVGAASKAGLTACAFDVTEVIFNP